MFAVFSSFALFWCLALVNRDSRLSAAAVCIVLCFGTPIAFQGILRYVPNLNFLIPMWISELVRPASAYHLPFLRFYLPAVAFPLFFVFCALVWLALTSKGQRGALASWAFGALAGITFVALVFSYFYLWTAAVAWLVSVCALWLVGRRAEWRRVLIVLGVVMVTVAPGMIVYLSLLAKRASTVDSAQALVLTHRPDLFRPSEIAVMIVLAVLIIAAVRRFLTWSDPLVLFTASLALTVLAVFNQQVVTGRSLQPIHYEWFIGNYCALAAIVLTFGLWRRVGRGPLQANKHLLAVAVVALIWGGLEVWLAASINLEVNRQVDDISLVGKRLTQLAESDGTSQAASAGGSIPVVLVEDLRLADRLPTDAPQAILWAPRMLVFPGISEEENRERFFDQLYYLGYDSAKFNRKLDSLDWNFYAGMFPYYRLSRVVSGHSTPIYPEEIREQTKRYLDYSASFTGERAEKSRVSYLVLSASTEPNWTNLDRWYVHDEGERIGSFVLYRVKLKN